MKFKKIIAGIITATFMFANFTLASATQNNISYIKVLDGDYVNITGQITDGAQKEVLIRIDYTDKAPKSDSQGLEENVVYQEQTSADENGKFDFKVKLKDIGERTYTLNLGVLGEDIAITEAFVFYGPAYRNEALNAIQNAQKSNDVSALAQAIKKYYANLYLQTPIFDEYLKTDSSLAGIKSILGDCPVITSISMLESSLEGVVIVKDIKQCKNSDELKNVFSTYKKELGIIDSTIYQKTYDGLKTELKNDVYKTFLSKKYYTVSEICEAFTVSVLNTYLKNAVGASSVKKVLSDNEDLLGINLRDYNMSDSYYQKLIGMNFQSTSEVKTKLDELKKSYKNSQSANSGGGGSGGGGGGNQGSSSVVSTTGQNLIKQNDITEKFPFEDMENYIWAKEAVMGLYNDGIVAGVSEEEFEPDRVVTREEFLKMIIAGFGIEPDTDGDITFSDVDKTAWYYQFVKKGVNSKIISGMDNNTFGVGNKITRQDMVVMLYRAMSTKMELPEMSGSGSFEDIDTVSDYAKNAVLFTESKDIVNGMGDGNFHPHNNANRAEAAVILYRAVEYLKENK